MSKTPQPASSEQLWTTLRQQLSVISSVNARINSIKQVNLLQVALQNDAEPLAALRPKLESVYAQLLREVQEDDVLLTSTIDNVNSLIAIKNAPEPPPPEKRTIKKRRLDTNSPAPESPAPTPAISVSTAPATSAGPLSAVPSSLNTASTRNASPGPPTPGTGRAKTPRLMAKEALLYDGRPIAFKTPPVKGRPTKDADKKKAKEEAVEGGTWILARIVRCVDKEKSKYEVQDVDEENGTAALYTTTPKSIIALPDPKNKDSFPSTTYRVGAEVLAVYPEVTALYRARVRDPPTARNNHYSVVFEGDQGAVSQVAAEHICDWPGN